ncbi:MAG: hypothetical protein ISS82_04645 [Nanoarchaeota archaeon]|nr:hypothetical protein [Nanoarchaeota archaeon]
MPIPTVLTGKMSSEDYENNKNAIRKLISRLTRQLRHERIDIKRKENEKGERIIEVWSTHPDFVNSELKKIFKK